MIVVAFPGGAGGHFIGHLVMSLLSQTCVSVTPQTNFHSVFSSGQSFLNFSFLDHSNHSMSEELNYINQFNSQVPVIIGHFRNIDEIFKKHQCKIITITVNIDDADLLVSRVLREAINHNFKSVKYQDIRGEDWPLVNPGYSELPKWIQLEIQSQLHKMFYNWNSFIKVKNSFPLTLTTTDIFYGDVVEKIANYINVPVVDDLILLHDNYKKIVQQKYLPNASSRL